MVTDKIGFSATVRMLQIYNILRIFRLTLILAGIYIRYRERMEIKIDSSNPQLWLFRFYKVCLFCTYREIHGRRKILPSINI
jgi:hypothetical protein